jgi:alkylation response protein AidB-like acyl-CoA dehydrogenase
MSSEIVNESLDFGFSDDQEALRDLAVKILTDLVTHERLTEIGASEDWFDRRAWQALADAGLLGIGLPEAYGGGGLGFLEVCIVAEQVGATVAPVPMVPTAVAALTIAEFGDDEQRARWLPGAANGETILTLALQEPNNDDPTAPTTRADVGRDGWRLSGTVHCVQAAHLAAGMLVAARTGVGVGLFLVDPHGDGVTRTRAVATNGEPVFHLDLDGASGEPLGDPVDGVRVITWTVEHALAALCVVQVGVSERSLRMTAEYASTREQFGHPIAGFQAVSQRAADAYIDTEAMRLTAWQAAWRVAVGLPAADEVAIAKFWAADGGQRVAHAAQHLHGGLGIDVDYPLHRYFQWSKAIELTLGSATRQLVRLGASIAQT